MFVGVLLVKARGRGEKRRGGVGREGAWWVRRASSRAEERQQGIGAQGPEDSADARAALARCGASAGSSRWPRLYLDRPFFRSQTDPQLEWQQLYFTFPRSGNFLAVSHLYLAIFR